MLREYCEKCKKELPSERLKVEDPDQPGIQTIVTFCLEHGLTVDELYGPEFLF